MPTVKRILCPVDLSDASRRALDYALALGRHHEADVRVLQVVDLHGWAGASVEGLDALTGQTRAALEEQLGWWVARSVDGAGASTDVREGPVVPGILAAAREAGIDLIVMGTHGRSGFERLALGSVAEKVLRKAACPVLVVPTRQDAIVRTGLLSRVVCATDFSEPSLRALAWARMFVGDALHALSLVNVIDWPLGDTHGSDPVTQLRHNLEQEATESLRRIADDGGASSAELVVRHGKAGHQLLQYAREAHAELIVMGVSGRGAIDRALLGSTAQRVLRDAPCPVLAVPATGAHA
ncbi:MAG: universal stress protein [Acidobacteria bacterium]|nr:universal stress protein [Acidobacteriota bacterium]